MRIHARPYRDAADLAAMRQLLIDGSQADILASYMHPGYLDLAAHYPPDEQARRTNLRLWEYFVDGSSALAAWAIFLAHEATLDLFVHPTLHGTPVHELVMGEYVAWAEARARAAGLKQLQPFWILEYDSVMDRLMRRHGFVVVSSDLPPPLFERSLDELPPVVLPDGYRVQGVANLDDARLRAQVTHGAFCPKEDWGSFAEEYLQFVRSAVYAGERDLFVRAPDGRGAAACTIWFDPVNRVGLFEPVATHPDFQRRGLGKAVMAEGLRRMQAAGMQRAILGFDPNNAAARGLYTAMGFRASCYFVLYHKALPATG